MKYSGTRDLPFQSVGVAWHCQGRGLILIMKKWLFVPSRPQGDKNHYVFITNREVNYECQSISLQGVKWMWRWGKRERMKAAANQVYHEHFHPQVTNEDMRTYCIWLFKNSKYCCEGLTLSTKVSSLQAEAAVRIKSKFCNPNADWQAFWLKEERREA